VLPGATAPAGGAREILEITTATMDFLVPQNENQAAHRRDVLAALDPSG